MLWGLLGTQFVTITRYLWSHILQLEESEAEVSSQNQLLSTLSAELAHEREELEQEERQEGALSIGYIQCIRRVTGFAIL